MDTYVIEQFEFLQTTHTLVPALESRDRLAMHIVVRPSFVPRRAKTAPIHGTGSPVTGSALADDIAEATWEDAEWR